MSQRLPPVSVGAADVPGQDGQWKLIDIQQKNKTQPKLNPNSIQTQFKLNPNSMQTQPKPNPHSIEKQTQRQIFQH